VTTHSAANPSPGARGQAVARPPKRSSVEATELPCAVNRPAPLAIVTVEIAVYAFLVLLAVAIRLWDLGSQPLSPRESGLALSGIRFDANAPPADVGAFLRHGGALAMTLFGATDFSARLVPALAGIALPLSAYLLRPLLGHTVAVIGAGLLVFSPLMVDQSRLVGNGSIVAALALVAFALGARLVTLGRWRDLWPLAVALGLLIVSGPGGLSVLTVFSLLVVGAVVLRTQSQRRQANDAAPGGKPPSSRGLGNGQDGEATRLFWPDATNLRSASVVFAVSALVMASGALTNIAGIGETIASAFGAWLDGFSRSPSAVAPASLWIVPVYEPLSLVVGILGGAIAWRSRDLIGRAIVAWAVLSLLLLAVRPGRQAEEVALLVVPLAILTAIAVTHLIVEVTRHRAWRPVGAVVLAMSILAGLQGYVTSHLTDPRPYVGDAVIVMPMLVAALVLYAFYNWTDARITGLGFLSFAVLAMTAFSVHNTWQLAYFSTGNVSELTRQHQTTTDARTLVRDVEEIRSVLSLTQQDTSVALAGEFSLPLAWYLREIPDLRVEPEISGSPAIAIADRDSRPPVGTYTGQAYLLTIEGQSTFASWRKLWRWWLYRDPPGEPSRQSVTLFVRGQ
jgi:uncharacterized protein (TIGR03663 family)